MIEIVSEYQTRKTRKSTVFTKSFCIYIIKPCQICYGFFENDSILNGTFSVFTKIIDIFNKHIRRHMTLEGLSSVCAKLEPASFKNNENTRDKCPAKISPNALLMLI